MAKLAIFIDDPRFDLLAEGYEDASAAYLEAIKEGIVDISGDMRDGTIRIVSVHAVSNKNDVKLTLVPTDGAD